MLSKVVNPRFVVGKIMRGRRKMSQYSPTQYREPHMNDAAIPQGSWEAGYKRRQVSNNATLAIGITFFLVTVTCVYNSGIINMNWAPPMKND